MQNIPHHSPTNNLGKNRSGRSSPLSRIGSSTLVPSSRTASNASPLNASFKDLTSSPEDGMKRIPKRRESMIRERGSEVSVSSSESLPMSITFLLNQVQQSKQELEGLRGQSEKAFQQMEVLEKQKQGLLKTQVQLDDETEQVKKDIATKLEKKEELEKMIQTLKKENDALENSISSNKAWLNEKKNQLKLRSS